MATCFATVAAEIIRMTLKEELVENNGENTITITLAQSDASPNRARGAPLYHPNLMPSWGPWSYDGCDLLDARGYLCRWSYADAQRWIALALNGTKCRVVISYVDGAAIPPKWTPKRKAAAAKKIADMSGSAIRDAAEAKRQTVKDWAESERKHAVDMAGARMGDAAQYVDLAQQMQGGDGFDGWGGDGDGGGNSGET